mmetsp:Transcript_6210/g.14980  ORF Transcript_6210/g.14980 Transcript_6210/m.14980 type:complete len:277 (-) Transcript_6210:427-1257(-)
MARVSQHTMMPTNTRMGFSASIGTRPRITAGRPVKQTTRNVTAVRALYVTRAPIALKAGCPMNTVIPKTDPKHAATIVAAPSPSIDALTLKVSPASLASSTHWMVPTATVRPTGMINPMYGETSLACSKMSAITNSPEYPFTFLSSSFRASWVRYPPAHPMTVPITITSTEVGIPPHLMPVKYPRKTMKTHGSDSIGLANSSSSGPERRKANPIEAREVRSATMGTPFCICGPMAANAVSTAPWTKLAATPTFQANSAASSVLMGFLPDSSYLSFL